MAPANSDLKLHYLVPVAAVDVGEPALDFPLCSSGTSTVAGIPNRKLSSGSFTKTRTSYTKLVRNSGVCTSFGVNSATGEIKPIQPGKRRPGKLSTTITAAIPGLS